MRKETFGRGSTDDNGFTLIELILAILILGVITVPLANVVIGYFRNADATTARLLESHDVQIASAYWAQDVASIGTRGAAPTYTLNQSVERGTPYTYVDTPSGSGVTWNSGLYPCGTASTPRAVVRLAWDNFIPDVNGSAVTTLVRVAYVVAQTGSGRTLQTELHRLRCEGPASTPLTFNVVSDVVVAHDLDPLTPPAVECLGASGTACDAKPDVPTKVTLNLTLKNPSNRDSAYVVALTGQRRESP